MPGVRFEAAWKEPDAICVALIRVPQKMTLDHLAETCPRLWDRLGTACNAETAGRFDTPLLFIGSRDDGIIEADQP